MEHKKQRFLDILKRFLAPMKKDKIMYIWFFGTYALRPIFGIFTIIMVELITKQIEVGNKSGFMVFLVVFFAGAVLIQAIAIITRDKGRPTATTISNIHTYEDSIRKLICSNNTEFEKLGTGKIMAIFNNGIDTWNRLLIDFIKNSMSLTMSGAFAIYLMFRVSWWFVLVFVIVMFFVNLIVIKANTKTVKQRNITRDIRNERTRKFVKIIMSKFEILQNNKIEIEIQGLKDNSYQRFLSEKKRSLVTDFVFRTPEFGAFLIRFLIFTIVGYGIFNNTFSFANLVMFSGALSLIDGVISNFVQYYFDFTSKINDVTKLRDTLDKLTHFEDIHNNKKKFIYKFGNIQIQNVDFSYDKSPIFLNFSLSIKVGAKTAFVGESGGGKTTLIKLLAGYIRPDKGEIEIDGQKLSEIKLADYYKHIGYLSQDPSVFDGTIHENLVYVLDSEPKKEDLERVIKLSKCEFIREFEKGLETEIGERGIRLSGGQKQRLAIAKIMLKNPNIILLDEPTSALDSFNEEQIGIALNNLFKGKTVVVVAHRLQTVKQSDRICYIEQGKIIEEGSHDELVALGGRYKKMLDLQSGF